MQPVPPARPSPPTEGAGAPGQARGLQVPELQTARLRLRGHRPADFPALCALWGDAGVTRHLGGPANPEAVWARLLRYGGHWAQLGFGYWLIECRDSGRYMGEAGLACHRRALVPAVPFDRPEAGWVLTPAAQGQGLGAEAMAAVLAWGDRWLAQDQSFALIDADNQPSLRLAARLGYGGAEPALHGGRACLMLHRPRVVPGA